MSQEIVNPLQTTSYTNKDFNSIYTELLDLTKKISYRWDPTISNESDPGVILLKLNAIIADKCNYIADQNILECFPLSVAQQKNARQLYSQLGYYMKWYRGAILDVTMSNISNSINSDIVIKPFTMIGDETGSVIYSILGPSSGRDNPTISVAPVTIPASGDTILCKTIQGIAIEYSIDQDTTITYDCLDSKNRLYFTSTDVAENGVFICNVEDTIEGVKQYNKWQKKDNLNIEDLNNYYYSFGLTEDGSACYIEFPEDAETLFGSGLNITYIKTLGESGNISRNVLSTFYSTVTYENGEFAIDITSDDVKIINYTGTSNGSDPEDLYDAYKNYKRTSGTFNTLVTLRDYINCIYTSGLVSNVVVSDYYTDPQTSWRIKGYDNSISYGHQEKQELDELKSKYGIKIIALQYVSNFDASAEKNNSATAYNKSFNISRDNTLIESYIEDIKSISHDLLDIEQTTDNYSNVFLFKNYYELNINIIPTYNLSRNEIAELNTKIRQNLYTSLNSRRIDFGEAIDYQYLKQIVEETDSRISAAIIDLPKYSTYSVRYDGNNFIEDEINSFDNEFIIENNASSSVVVSNIDDFAYCYFDIIKNYSDILPPFPTLKLTCNSSAKTIGYSYNNQSLTGSYSYTDAGLINTASGSAQIRPSIKTQIQYEIYAKSVLAGSTELVIEDDTFNYTLDSGYKGSTATVTDITNSTALAHGECYTIDNIIKLRTALEAKTDSNGKYVVRDNELIQFYSANDVTSDTFTNNVYYEIKLSSTPRTIKSGEKVTLSNELDISGTPKECIIFYWKTDASSTDYHYKLITSTDKITYSFTPNFDLTIPANYVFEGIALLQGNKDILSENSGILHSLTYFNLSERVSGLNKLTNDNAISITYPSEVVLDTYNKDYKVYFVLNSKHNELYTLFSTGATIGTSSVDGDFVILNPGEYLIYASANSEKYAILGAGTKIELTNLTATQTSSLLYDIAVPVSNDDNIISDIFSSLDGYWLTINSSSNYTFKIVEQKIKSFTSGTELYVKDDSGQLVSNFKFYNETNPGRTVDFSNLTLSYKLPKSQLVEQLENNKYSVIGNLKFDSTNTREQALLDGQYIYYTTFTGNYDDEGNEIEDYSGKISYPAIIQTGKPISVNSSTDISTIYVNEDDELEYQSIYTYARNIKSSSYYRQSFNNDLSLTIRMTQDTSEGNKYAFIGDFYFIPGKYVVVLENKYAGDPLISHLGLYFKQDIGSTSNPIIPNVITSFIGKFDSLGNGVRIPNNKKHIPLLLTIPGDIYSSSSTKGYYLDLTVYQVSGKPRKELTFTLYPVSKFDASASKVDYINDKFIHNVTSVISTLDKTNSFNTTLEVPSDINIENPLDANAFFNKNHIYNKYTISQLDTKKYSFKINAQR